MTMQFADIARQAAADGAISADEILALRRMGWSDGSMRSDEVSAIFDVNDALAEPTAEWSDFFVEAVGEYVINGAEPRGYVSEDAAGWLIERVDRDGELKSMTELELLVRVLERGLNVPQRLKSYILQQIEQAVLTGSGPTRNGELVAGSVNATEAALLRRVLFAPAGDGPAGISCVEAEMLFRLKDAALGADNAPEWKRMFVQGVANYLQGVASRTAQISREQALELETFVADDSTHVTRFLGRMVQSAPDAFGVVFGKKQPALDPLAELTEAEKIDAGEQQWLDSHVEADGAIDEYEQALITFLAKEA
ncbi:MAG: hypothetical protein J7493_07225 [Porphyrobacter sp.]|nr:hypothetical protein [Porphyrobacter sp.]